jgi:hypothetical protein
MAKEIEANEAYHRSNRTNQEGPWAQKSCGEETKDLIYDGSMENDAPYPGN